MPAFTATAPGKVILFGEHAVVYGRPAVAVPVHAVQARVIVRADVRAPRGSVRITSPEINLDSELRELAPLHPLRRAVELTAEAIGASYIPACQILIQSNIPVASGLGSGAAVSIALIRALSAYLGRPLPAERVSALAFEVEKIHHGSPSGVDNTVIAFETPVVYLKGAPIQPLSFQIPLHLLIADTGIPSPTAQAVSEVRAGWQADPPRYEQLFNEVGAVVQQAIDYITNPPTPQEVAMDLRTTYQKLGELMNQNHILLRKLGVSCPELESLTQTARLAGAYGAKLSGGGKGGNLIALVDESNAETIRQALENSGAKRVIYTVIR